MHSWFEVGYYGFYEAIMADALWDKRVVRGILYVVIGRRTGLEYTFVLMEPVWKQEKGGSINDTCLFRFFLLLGWVFSLIESWGVGALWSLHVVGRA